MPPKYISTDFLRPSYWKARGKLDVPKERFVSYGQTNAATPELYGWPGWIFPASTCRSKSRKGRLSMLKVSVAISPPCAAQRVRRRSLAGPERIGSVQVCAAPVPATHRPITCSSHTD
ncbi:hypothetical protein GCM10010271_36480 [Streptomyces kurssanovii]|nr:hypothetical protein GCM10010271_36480 [Streptomyces kurssanovii]